MKSVPFKYIVAGLLFLPLLLLAAYTFRGQNATLKKSSLESLKLTTPADTADEIAQYISEDDNETALIEIEKKLKDPNIPTSKGLPLLVFAAEKNNLELVTTLLAMGADANFADVNSGESALIKAARNGNNDMITILLASNANVNAVSKYGITPLLAAIAKNDAVTANSLISRGARAGVSKENLLAYAFQRNPLGIDIMLKGGADPDYADANGNTALMVTASTGDLESVRSLLDYRANPNLQNKHGMTALLYAVKNKNFDISRSILNSKIKTDINLANKQSETPLYWAAYLGQDKIVDDLLLLGADYSKANNKGVTPLQIASANGHPLTAKKISDYIGFKNIPRDEKGRPIAPKKTVAASNMQTAKAAKNTPDPDETDLDKVMNNISIPPQAAAAAANAPQGSIPPQTQALLNKQQAGSNKPKFERAPKQPAQSGTQKTVINKLKTSSL